MGFLTFPLTNGIGWGAVSLGKGGKMAGPALVVAWPNGDKVMTTFRQASGYTNPGALKGNQTLFTVPEGTFVNATHVSVAYLCKNCIDDELTFPAASNITVMGFALAATAPTTPSDPMSELQFHSKGFGQAGFDIPSAANAKFDTWAALATEEAGASGDSPTPTDPGTAPTATVTAEAKYDAIVVGGGTSGIIVAARLAEAGEKVLLIERGSASVKSSGGNITVPWSDEYTVFDVPALNYELNALPEADQWLCTDTASMAGCLLGGSSSINGMIFVKPSKNDFLGYPEGWSFEDIEPVAEKVYAQNPPTEISSEDGKLYDQSTYQALAKALAPNGWRNTSSINDVEDKDKVYQHPPMNVADGIRSGPVQTYLPNVRDLDNFELMLDTYVVRAVRNGGLITGIETRNGSTATIYQVNAGGKVIFAGGALGTPRLLFNSGIGPKDQLNIVKSGSTFVTLPEEADWIDLPVGQGIRNHPLVTMKLETKSSKIQDYDMGGIATEDAVPLDINLFLNSTSGLFTQNAQRVTIYSTAKDADGNELVFQGSVSTSGANKFQIKWNLTRGGKSSGVVGITPTGATELVQSPYLTDAGDKAAFAAMLDGFVAMLANQTDVTLAADMEKNGTAMVNGGKSMANHWNGGAQLGDSNDGTSVVDPNTKVWGTDNLYVVDASIFVRSTAGNTVAPVMVVAEMAAKKILESAGTPSEPTTSDPSGPSSTSTSSAPTEPTTTTVPSEPTTSSPSEPTTSAPAEPTTTPAPTTTCAARK
ncbi:hypothetical protein BKA62DRAFT_722227 [Auriculariales sp. MPI-PUGE-AT-0066]|nr:hypothetical protein BKA62DRAFT_722227 [Auriculariales sp. MPI-PUGE-AT-0066]